MESSLYEEMDSIFHPRSVAAVGVSDKVTNQGMSFLLGHQKLGFSGPVYAIHPTKTIKRFETYPNIKDVPGPVDYVKVCVPARSVPEVVRDCAEKGVRCATIFSSGFRESGTEEGRELEDEVAAIARQGGVRIIGPNCMGIYSPESGQSIRVDMPAIPDGRIGMVSQSGGVAISAALMASEKGVGFSKLASYGNECDLGPPEFLHYLSRDPKTHVICLYIEGTRRPDELKAALKDAAARKPVIMLKGGTTRTGNRAVASHTGAMTGTAEVWKALAAQCGCPVADDLDEMLDLAYLFSLSRPPKSNNICLFSVSGGFGVFATDQVINAGFNMPELDKKTREALLPYVDAPGTSIKNPLDLAAQFFQPHNYQYIFPALDADPGVDAYIIICAIEYLTYLNEKASEWSGFMARSLMDGMATMKKPVYVVFYNTVLTSVRHELENEFIARNFPVFPDMGRCLKALQRSRARQRRP
ncbi:MAG: CoA-binding protein [bacterium]